MNRDESNSNLLQSDEMLVSDSADVYLLFVSLSGCTTYKYDLFTQGQPDIIWISRQLVFLNRSADIVKKYNGVIVKTIENGIAGDNGIFVYFEAATNPFDILNCGIEIIQSFDDLKTYKGKSKIKTRISIDFGETYNGTISKSIPFDPIGLPVERCTWLNFITGPNQIIFSDEFLKRLATRKSLEEIRQKYGITSKEAELRGLGNVMFHIYRCLKNPHFYDIADVIKDDSDLILDHSTTDEIYFIPTELDDVIPKVGKRGRVWPTDRILLFSVERRLIDLYNPESRLMLSLVFGPGDKGIRDKLYNIAKQTPHFFLSSPEDGEEPYFEFGYPRHSLIMKPTLAIFGKNTDIDGGRIRTEIEEWMNGFKQSVFSEMTEKIKEGMATNDASINTIHDEFRRKLKEIADLSKKINKNDNKKILGLIKEHIEEVEDLYKENNEHWAIETADLIVLCYELLVLENKDIDDVFNRCLPRFDVKLKRLAENVS